MRLIDADRLLEPRHIGKYYHLPNGDIALPIIDIEHAPTVDAVPVVRCKYCKYNINNARLFDDPDPILTYAWCNTEAFQENDFCSKGKRKEE